jgi:hypothetical protein
MRCSVIGRLAPDFTNKRQDGLGGRSPWEGSALATHALPLSVHTAPGLIGLIGFPDSGVEEGAALFEFCNARSELCVLLAQPCFGFTKLVTDCGDQRASALRVDAEQRVFNPAQLSIDASVEFRGVRVRAPGRRVLEMREPIGSFSVLVVPARVERIELRDVRAAVVLGLPPGDEGRVLPHQRSDRIALVM